jgi:hypothetical protein
MAVHSADGLMETLKYHVGSDAVEQLRLVEIRRLKEEIARQQQENDSLQEC